jgi:uncharacterized protein YrrD
MFVLANQLRNIPIISLQTGQVVAHSDKPIINPSDLQVVALFCQPKGWIKPNAALLTKDIRQTSPQGILIDSSEEIEDYTEIIRLKDLVARHFELTSLPVYTEGGTKLGKVEEYTIGLSNYVIQKLYLRQSALKHLLLTSLVIDREQIVDVTPKQITVRDATIKNPILAPQPAPPSTP